MMHWAKVDSFFKQCCSCLGDNMRSFIVFGSVARGENRQDSDIDLLILIGRDTNENDVCSLQTIVRDNNNNDGPRLSVNVAAADDFIAHVALGDPFSVSVALEGHCLLNSTDFSTANPMVRDDCSLPDKSGLVKRLRSNATAGAVELMQEMLPRISEQVYSVVSGYLTASGLERKGIESWQDLTVHASPAKLLDNAHQVWGLQGRKIVQSLLDIRKGEWGKLVPLIKLLKQIADYESEEAVPLAVAEKTGRSATIGDISLDAMADVDAEARKVTLSSLGK
jgi:hypothetical protein